MPSIESESNRVILHDGGTTLTLDKAAGEAVLQRKMLLWNRKPVVFPLAEIDDIAVAAAADPSSHPHYTPPPTEDPCAVDHAIAPGVYPDSALHSPAQRRNRLMSLNRIS
jgi:hypothetical protein